MRITALLSLLVFFLLPATAHADCTPYGSFPEFRGDTVHFNIDTDNGACGLNFSLGGRDSILLQSLKVSEQALHGAVATTEDFSFQYWAFKSYQGPDKFSIEVCGVKNGQSGCSIAIATVNVTGPSQTDLTPAMLQRSAQKQAKKK